MIDEHFTSWRPRPLRFSDPFKDFTPDQLKELLATPDESMGWRDYWNILGFLPAGNYDESVYFLPLAFDYVLARDEDALDLVTPLVWFISEHVAELETDGRLNAARAMLTRCLRHWTRKFDVIHFDEDACRVKGWRLAYFDYVEGVEVVCECLTDMVRYRAHCDLAENLIRDLSSHLDRPLEASWFLELARANTDVRHPPNHPPIQSLLQSRVLLRQAANTVTENCLRDERSPTYWNDTFSTLNL